MKHEHLDELRLRAEVLPSSTEVRKLSRRERIERWATLLEQHQGRLLPFIRTEYLSYHERRALRGDDSPLAVAFRDPLLRADGLTGDTLGEGLAYFGLSEQKAHRLLCDCHYAGTMTGMNVATRLRASTKAGLAERFWEWATGRGDDR